MNAITVPTPETTALQKLMTNYISARKPCLLIGSAGCGKTQLVKGLLKDLNIKDPSSYLFNVINFNYFTNADILQVQLGLPPLEKKAGTTWAPKGKALLIYFVDDLNMQKLDKYNTQNSISLLR